MRSFLFALLVCASSTAPAAAPEQVQADTSPLVAAYRAALDHDTTYRAARDEARAAREQVEQARAAWQPSVVASASASRNHLDQTIGNATRSASYTSNSVALQWRQPLMSRELQSRENLARLRAEQAEALMDVRHGDLVRRLVDAYLDVVLAHRSLAFLKEELARQTELVDAARKGIASGEGTLTDLLEASSRRELLEAQRVSAQAGLENGLDALALITGRRALAPDQALIGSRLDAMPDGPLLGDIETALPEHPQRRFRFIALAMAREEVNLAGAGNAPRLDWVATASRGDSDAVNSFNQVNRLWSAGVQFTLPLLDGGRAGGGERAALALVDKALAELDDAERTLGAEARQSLRALHSSSERAAALRSARKASEQLVAATRRSLAAGLRSRLDLLQAERQLAQVRREQDQAAMDHLRSWWRAVSLQRQAFERDLRTLELTLR